MTKIGQLIQEDIDAAVEAKLAGERKAAHVLGLFDAYGYAEHFITGGFWLPEAPASNATQYSVMRSVLRKPMEYNDIEYEMMLYAWSTNSLQLYTNDSILGDLSQAFYH
jgi:hypothetical protein